MQPAVYTMQRFLKSYLDYDSSCLIAAWRVSQRGYCFFFFAVCWRPPARQRRRYLSTHVHQVQPRCHILQLSFFGECRFWQRLHSCVISRVCVCSFNWHFLNGMTRLIRTKITAQKYPRQPNQAQLTSLTGLYRHLWGITSTPTPVCHNVHRYMWVDGDRYSPGKNWP